MQHYVRPLPVGAADNARTRERTVGAGPRGTGARYRINSPRSVHHGGEFICLGAGGGYDRLPTWRFRAQNGTAFEIAQTNCVLVAGEAPAGRGPWNRPFVVGDRVQVARGWDTGMYPLGLCGTVTRTPLTNIIIQFDPPGYATMVSSLGYIHLVLEGTQPDVPRTRIPPPAAAVPVAPVDQRHTVDANYVRTYPLPAAPAGGAAPQGPIVIGSRVRRLNEAVDGVQPGTLGTVVRMPDGHYTRVRWDDGRNTNNFRRNLELVVEAPAAPPPPAPLPEVREVRVEAERTIIASTYHCVFRNGNRGAGFDTLEEALASLGRRTRIDRREFFNTAPHMRWVENVPY